MARIRSIHPGLTSDEAYMSMSITAKAAWTPLWMQCDDHGIFEWKPIVLKALIFPADAVDMASLLEEWVSLGCIKKIDVDGKACGVVRNFSRYQRPKNPSYRYFKADELPTDISKYIGVRVPAPPVLPQSSPSTTEVLPQRKEEGGRREEEKKEITQPVAKATRGASEKFEEFWKERPRRDGDDPRKPAEKKFNALVKTGVDPDVIISGAKMATIAAKERGVYGTKFVPQTVKWLNDQRFADYAAEAYSAADQSKVDDEAFWDSILTSFKRFGHWSGQAGPGLDSPGCRVPDEMLAKHGLSRTPTVTQTIDPPRLKSMGDLH